jgi:uncharacterized protein YneF (UPF0154 family)
MWTVALYMFMLGLFVLGLIFGIFFGVFIADKLREDLENQVGKRKF